MLSVDERTVDRKCYKNVAISITTYCSALSGYPKFVLSKFGSHPVIAKVGVEKASAQARFSAPGSLVIGLFVTSSSCSLMDIRQTLTTLAEEHKDALQTAMVRLMIQPSWSLETTMVLMQTEKGFATIGPVSALPSLLEHTRPELDTFLRLQDEGMDFEEAYQHCLEEQGQDFLEACEVAEKGRALLTYDTLVEFAALSQKGFARNPRELLVVAKWPDYVTAFLVSCQLL